MGQKGSGWVLIRTMRARQPDGDPPEYMEILMQNKKNREGVDREGRGKNEKNMKKRKLVGRKRREKKKKSRTGDKEKGKKKARLRATSETENQFVEASPSSSRGEED